MYFFFKIVLFALYRLSVAGLVGRNLNETAGALFDK